MSYNTLLNKYSELAVRVGMNVQHGQQVIINAPIEAVDMVRLVTEHAYKAGASNVVTFYNDDVTSRMKYTTAEEQFMGVVPEWLFNAQADAFGAGACRLVILGNNPTLLDGIDPKLISMAGAARGKAGKRLRDLVTNSASQWSIVGYATKEWAAQVFPELDADAALEKLWDGIFKTARVSLDTDTIAEWEAHNSRLHARAKTMNDHCFDGIQFVGDGTDLYVGLADGHVWEGGSGLTEGGIPYNANIPTEEVFTTPMRNNVEGIAQSTKPLLYRGVLIDEISVIFDKGQAIEATSSTGMQTLHDMINEDEGASYLGEVALVPHNSPISNSGILYRETLYDENASCHIAFGQSYKKCMTEIEGETPEQLFARGANNSKVHTDWMIGSDKVNVYGVKGDKKIKIIEGGEWVL